MKVLIPNHGVVESKKIYSSCLVTNAFIDDSTGRQYFFLFEYIPELKLRSTYFKQGNWSYYEGEVFNAETKKAIDFEKESTFQNYTYLDNQLINCEKLTHLGKLKIEKTTEHLYLIEEGEYNCYFYSTSNNSSSSFIYGYLLLDHGATDLTVFRVFEKDEFYCFELTPQCLICWKMTESIDNYFTVEDTWADLPVAYRKHKISQITAS